MSRDTFFYAAPCEVKERNTEKLKGYTYMYFLVESEMVEHVVSNNEDQLLLDIFGYFINSILEKQTGFYFKNAIFSEDDAIIEKGIEKLSEQKEGFMLIVLRAHIEAGQFKLLVEEDTKKSNQAIKKGISFCYLNYPDIETEKFIEAEYKEKEGSFVVSDKAQSSLMNTPRR